MATHSIDSKPIVILFLGANPPNTTPLRLDEEARAIYQALRQGEYRDQFDLRPHFAVHVADLEELLMRYKPHIVHFSGHGTPAGQLLVEDDRRREFAVPPDALSRLFAILGDNLRCVVLNACYTATQAEVIAEHIDCVVGLPDAIGDAASISFASSFYKVLANGLDVKKAFDLGCNSPDLLALDAPSKPKLLAERIDPSQVIFAVSSQPGGDSPAEVNWDRKTTSMDVSSKDLPCQDAGTLFGRKQELKRIGEFLSVVGGASFLNIWGMPGIGKTALVRKAVCDCIAESGNLHPEQPFGPKVWLGDNDLHKLDDLVKIICVKLDRKDILRQEPESQPTLVRQALKQIVPQRSLIIIDDLDKISDGLVVKFLGQLGQEAKVIAITSRRMDALGFEYEREEIKELQEEEALQLIRSRFESREVPFTETVVRKLYDRIEGVPYALRLIIGEFSRDFPPDSRTIDIKLRGLTGQDGDIAAKCFDSNFNSIQDKPALRVLQALALFPKGASPEALESIVAGIDDDQQPFGDIVETLEHRALVHQSANRVWLSPLTRQYTQQHMSQRVCEGLQHRFVDYFIAFARDNGTHDCWLGSVDWEGTYAIEREWSNVWQAILFADKLHRWADVIFFEYYLFHGLAFHDRWTERLDLGNKAITAMEALEIAGSPVACGEKWLERKARIHIDTLGWVYCHRGQYPDMRKEVGKGLEIIESLDRPNRDLQAIASCYLSRADHNEISISGAQLNLSNVREYENGMHASVIARLRSYTGELQSAAGDWSAARASFEEGLLIRQAIGEQIGIATNRLQLANVEFKLGHYEEAKALFKESMSDEKIRGVNLALARFGLAQIDWVEEEYKQALALVGEAVTEFGRLGMESDMKQAMELVGKVVTEFERLGMEPELKRAMEIRKQWLEQEKV